MSLPFARAVRALQAERDGPSLVALLISMGLVSAWAAWFFLAPMTRSTTGQIVGSSRRGTVLATLSPEAAAPIQRGQAVVLHLRGARTDQMETLPGTVADVTRKAEHVRVEVYITPQAAAAITWHAPLTGQVEIAVEHLSPATLLAQTTGQFRALPVGPRSAVPR